MFFFSISLQCYQIKRRNYKETNRTDTVFHHSIQEKKKITGKMRRNNQIKENPPPQTQLDATRIIPAPHCD